MQDGFFPCAALFGQQKKRALTTNKRADQGSGLYAFAQLRKWMAAVATTLKGIQNAELSVRGIQLECGAAAGVPAIVGCAVQSTRCPVVGERRDRVLPVSTCKRVERAVGPAMACLGKRRKSRRRRMNRHPSVTP